MGEDTVLKAARELVVEVGYQALTFDAVASRAGVEPAVVRRRFATKAELVHHAVVPPVQNVRIIWTGDLPIDIRNLVETTAALYSTPYALAAAPGIMAEMYADAQLATVLRARIRTPIMAMLRELMAATIARGDEPTISDPEIILDVIAGAVLYRSLTGHTPLAPLVEALVRMLTPSQPPP